MRYEVRIITKTMSNKVRQIPLFGKSKILESLINFNYHRGENIFLDKKRFLLNLPGDLRLYVKNNFSTSFIKLQCNRDGVMVLIMVMPNEKVNSNNQLNLMKKLILPILFLKHRWNFFLQQGNIPGHIFINTNYCLKTIPFRCGPMI